MSKRYCCVCGVRFRPGYDGYRHTCPDHHEAEYESVADIGPVAYCSDCGEQITGPHTCQSDEDRQEAKRTADAATTARYRAWSYGRD